MTRTESTITGFSAMAAAYDESAVSNPIVVWMRGRVREIVEAQIAPDASILEINAGSGVDAAYFASRGYRVHATDVAPGMLESLADKAARPDLQGRLSFESLSFEHLGVAKGGPYDLVFSNLGGLNCTNDLASVARGLPDVLMPGGVIVCVLMPPFCPWELAQVLRGHLRTATRRLSKHGTLANVGGDAIRAWYHSPGKLVQALGPEFRVDSLRSFSCLAPPSYFEGFVTRHAGLAERLMRWDDALGRRWPLNHCGDFYALVARYEPGS